MRICDSFQVQENLQWLWKLDFMCLFICTDLWVRKHFYNVDCLLDFSGLVTVSQRNTEEPEPEEAFFRVLLPLSEKVEPL